MGELTVFLPGVLGLEKIMAEGGPCGISHQGSGIGEEYG